jgi:hypothetical protein
MSAGELAPTIRGGRIVDHGKYILETPSEVRRIASKYLWKKPVFVVGRGGTHLVCWSLCGWVVGKMGHVSRGEAGSKRRGLFVIDGVSSINDMDTLPEGIIVEAYRQGFRFGVKRIVENLAF